MITITKDDAQKNGFRYVQYKYELTNNNLEISLYYHNKMIGPGVDAMADAIAGQPQVEQRLADSEQDELQHMASEGEIVLHIDAGGYYVHSGPDWGTWEEHSTLWLKYWLGQEDQLELVNMKPDLDLFTNTELKDLLGIDQGDTSDIRAAVQVAVDTKAALDTYVPFVNNGVWV